MGYHLNSIYSISPDDSHSYFVFMLGGTYGLVNSTQEWLDKNFNAIAKALGSKAAIVRGLSSSFELEVVKAYQQQIKTEIVDFELNQSALEQVLNGLSKKYHIDVEAPILIITDRNPHKADNKNSVFYMIPIGNLEELEIQSTVEITLSCIRTNDFKPLDTWLTKKFGNAPLNALKMFNAVVKLEPGIAGISINLNAIIERFIKKITGDENAQ